MLRVCTHVKPPCRDRFPGIMDARLSINAQVKGSFLQFETHRMTLVLQINLALAETFSGTEYAPAARDLIALTAFVRLRRYVAAQVARGWFHEVLQQLLHSECDVILTPATAETAPLVPSNLHTGNAHDREVLRLQLHVSHACRPAQSHRHRGAFSAFLSLCDERSYLQTR